MSRLMLATCLALFLTHSVAGQPPAADPDEKLQLAFVSNGVAGFWRLAAAGVAQAAKELDVVAVTVMPHSLADQTAQLRDLANRGFTGIAVSPIDPTNQTELLNELAANTILITHDVDAPQSDRLVFIGIDNYRAGWMGGELVRTALPQGGDVALFIGRIQNESARLRRQGVIDAILEREPDPERRDPIDEPIGDDTYTIVATYRDGFDILQARQNVADALAEHDIDCCVGLFAYNTPVILRGLEQAGRLGKVQVVGFDEDEATLQGIVDGHVQATVVQHPYQYGYRAIELLHALAAGDQDVLPESEFIEIPPRRITRANVREFWADLKRKLGATEP